MDLTKIEAGSFSYHRKREDVYPLDLLAKGEKAFYLKEKGVDITVHSKDFPTTAGINSDKILQVLRNIIRNGLKYSPEEGRIRIHFSQSSQPSPFLGVHVVDEGKGIPEEKLERNLPSIQAE